MGWERPSKKSHRRRRWHSQTWFHPHPGVVDGFGMYTPAFTGGYLYITLSEGALLITLHLSLIIYLFYISTSPRLGDLFLVMEPQVASISDASYQGLFIFSRSATALCTWHPSLCTCHFALVTWHLSLGTCHLSLVTRHLSLCTLSPGVYLR